MGQSASKNIKEELQFKHNEWQQLTTNQFGAKCNNLYVHRRMRLWAEKTTVSCSPHHTIEEELSIYYYRKNPQSALVNVYAAQFQTDSKAPLCGNTQLINVVFERIPVRLSELGSLNLPDSLYVLSESIRGFKDCFQKVGHFDITEDMIGFNSQGFVKVWLNENFAQNHPTQQRIPLQVTMADKFKHSTNVQQTTMLNNLLDVIEQKTQKQYPKQFHKDIRQKQTFAEAYCEIERVCQEHQVWIPDRIPLSRYFGQFKADHTHIAEFKSGFHDTPRIQSKLSSQHATYIPNLKYQYPRNTYLTGTPTYQNQPQERFVPIQDTNKFSPIIYGSNNYRATTNYDKYHHFSTNAVINSHKVGQIPFQIGTNYVRPVYQQAPTFNKGIYLNVRQQ